jgi:flagella basal body P-ring formation protein FlgA
MMGLAGSQRHDVSLAAALLAGMVASAIHADTITLKPTVVIGERDNEVRLEQIAELDGPEAQRLADVVVMHRPHGDSSKLCLPVEQIREILTQSRAHWGRIDLHGRAVTIQVAGAAEGGLQAMAAISLSPQARPKPEAKSAATPSLATAESMIDAQTVRGELARMFCAKLNVPSRDLRIAFASPDKALLLHSLDSARFEIQPTSALATDRVTFVIRRWVDGRADASWNVTAHPEVRIQAASVTADIRKGQPIGAGDVETVEAWLPAGQAGAIASPDRVVARIATTQLKQGEFIRRADIQRQSIVQRGERVMVRCLVGGSVITMQAEARGDGGEGDVIELRKIGERDTFYATVSGPREAVVDLSRPVEIPSPRSPVAADAEVDR